jgi:hypothetical protein
VSVAPGLTTFTGSGVVEIRGPGARAELGSPRLIVNTSSGAVVEMDCDEFGNITNDTSAGLTPFGFALPPPSSVRPERSSTPASTRSRSAKVRLDPRASP